MGFDHAFFNREFIDGPYKTANLLQSARGGGINRKGFNIMSDWLQATIHDHFHCYITYYALGQRPVP